MSEHEDTAAEGVRSLLTEMDDLEAPTTIEEAVERVSEYGRPYALKCGAKCEGVKDNWFFQDGKIMGSQSDNPPGMSNEQWTNMCMEQLYESLQLSSIEPDAYYRFVAKKDEYEDAKLGNFRRSKNHRTKAYEPGKSVSKAPLLIYFVTSPYSFLLRGDPMKEKCSDRAPLLEINGNLKLASDLMPLTELLTRFYEHNKAVFDSTSRSSGVSEIDLFNLSLGMWHY